MYVTVTLLFAVGLRHDSTATKLLSDATDAPRFVTNAVPKCTIWCYFMAELI